MTEAQAAIGRIQLGKLERWLAKRRDNARVLEQAIAGMEALWAPAVPEHIGHAFYKFYAFIEPASLREGWSRDRVLEELREAGVPCGVGACPEVYRERAFEDAGLSPRERLPTARRLGEISMMFPVHPTLSKEDMDDMAGKLRVVMEKASKGRGGGRS